MASAAFTPDGGRLGYLRSETTAGAAVTLFALDDLHECVTPCGAVRPPRAVPRRFLGADAAGADDESNLSLEEKLRRERQRSLLVGITSFTWLRDGRVLFPQRGSLCIAEAGGTPSVAVDKAASGAAGSVLDAQPSKDGRWVAFVQEGEVYLSQLPAAGGAAAGGKPIQVTHGAREKGWTHGEADYLSQEELDRYLGVWWSPCGRYLAFQETDDTHVPPFRIVHVGAEPADSTAEEVHRYPFAGCARNPAVRLAVVDVSALTCTSDSSSSSGETAPALPTRYLHLTDGDDAGIYIPRVTWAPDSSLIVQLFNRPQTCSDLVRFDVASSFASEGSGATPLRGTLLLREVAPTGWFNVHDCLKFLPSLAASSSSPHLFTWASERTGFQHLYLYALPSSTGEGAGYSGPLSEAEASAAATTEGSLFAQPLSGGAARCLGALTWGDEWLVESLEAVTALEEEEKGWGLFFCGTADGPLQRHCYRLALKAEAVAAALAAEDAATGHLGLGSAASSASSSPASTAASEPVVRSFGPSQPYPVPGMQRITSGSGYHTVVVSPCGRFLADTLSSLHTQQSLALYYVPPFSAAPAATAAQVVVVAAPEPQEPVETTPAAAEPAAAVTASSSEATAAEADAGSSTSPVLASRSIADIAADSFANFIAFGAAKLEAAAAGLTNAASRAASRRQSTEDGSSGDIEAATGSGSGDENGKSGGSGLARFAPQRVSLGALGAVSVSTLSAFAAFVSPPEAGNAAAAAEGSAAGAEGSASGSSHDGDSSDEEGSEGPASRLDVAAAIDAAVAAVQANAAADEEAARQKARHPDVSRVLAAVVPLDVSGPYGGPATPGDAAPGAVPIRLLMVCNGTLPQWTAGNPESLAATIEGLRARMLSRGGTSNGSGADAAAAAARAALSRVVSPVSAASAALLDSVSHAVSQVSSAVSEAATRLTGGSSLPSPAGAAKVAAGGAAKPVAPGGSSPAAASSAAPAPAPASPAPLLVETLAADGSTPMYGALYLPDERRWGPGPYPTVVSVYGGPHVQRIRMEWTATADARAQALARAGILVAKFDNRGSFRRGAAFERALRHRMGTVEVDDQAAGVAWLVDCGLADPAAVGLYGWSYGGYMTLMCLARRPGVFHVGVSGAPVTDWAGYDTAYTERYMATPATNAAGYADGCVMSHVTGLASADLLLVHGLIDENVHVRHSYRLINAMTKARVPFTFLPFPNERHVPRGKEDMEYMEATIQRFLCTNLKRRAAEAAAAASAPGATGHAGGDAAAASTATA